MRTISDLKRPILLMTVLANWPVFALAAGSAQIDFSHGSVSAVAASGEQRALVKGGRVVSGETIKTGPEGRAQLRFDDGAMVSLQPQSEFRLDTYQFAGKQDGGEKGFFSLLKGGLRTITGLIGRTNKDAYKVTTSVATIGIRGTEYTLSYLDSETISVATGEGEIEICNGAGCVVLASGDSAVIRGPDGSVQRTGVRPRLDPTQPGRLLLADFSVVEGRNPDGSLAVVGSSMPSGPGYAMAYVHGSTTGSEGSVTAEFGSGSDLLSATVAGGVYKAGVVATAMSADGVIGWGRWASGVKADSTAVTDFHYVVAKPPSVSDLAALGVTTFTYNMIGFTTPTGSGLATGSPSGTLTASFGVTDMVVDVALTVPFNGTPYNVNGTTGSTAISGTFAFTGSANGNGVFSGANASHAGITYTFAAGFPGYGSVSGAMAFKR